MKWTWTDICNNKLHYQMSLAYDLKLSVPNFIQLESSDDVEKALLNPDVIVRGDIALQRPLGIKTGIAAYWNGEKFINFVGVTKDAFMFSGSQGYELTNNIMMLHRTDRKKESKFFKKAADVIKNKDESFRGFLQIHAIVDIKGVWWYENITFGAEPDFILAFKSLVENDDISGEIDIPKRYGASVRIFPVGYPNCGPVADEDIKFLKEVWDIEYIASEGTFFCYNSDSNIKDTWRKLYHKCAGIERFNYLYRIDGETICKHRFHELKENELV